MAKTPAQKTPAQKTPTQKTPARKAPTRTTTPSTKVADATPHERAAPPATSASASETKAKAKAEAKAGPKSASSLGAPSAEASSAKAANPKVSVSKTSTRTPSSGSAAAKTGNPAKTTRARLTLSSKNYSSWSLRGWLICRLAGLDFDEEMLSATDPSTRAELLLMAPSFRVPRLRDGEVDVWDTLAIADYLEETLPGAALYPTEIAARAHCRAVSGEMHSGFANLRAALPMNVKGRYPGFKVWAGAQADIGRILDIWRDCLARYGGPYLFGAQKSVADAMFAPVCSRFVSYDVALDPVCAAYRDHIMALPAMQEWIAAAETEPDELEELDIEF
jgi:glutathione S-transferase